MSVFRVSSSRLIRTLGQSICLLWLAAASLHADQVINDDLIVSGSVGIGVGAEADQAFGYDTFRLSETTLRVHFDDVSTSSDFPRNDWRIIINDNDNGGANYFAIEDATAGRVPFRIDAEAPANSIRVDSQGDLGIGTDNPVHDIHITTGDTPTIRLEQNDTSGWTAQTWNVSGNETNFFVRDITNGSTLPFRIMPSNLTNLLVLEDNSVGIGIRNPKAKLDLNGNLRVRFDAQDGDDQNAKHSVLVAPSTYTGTPTATMHIQGNAFISQNLEIGSSRSLKEDIRSLSAKEAMAALKDLEPVEYRYTDDDEVQLGFIAEDVPDIVATNSRSSLSPMDIIALLTRVVQEQEDQIESQQRQIDAFRNSHNEIEALRKSIEALSARLEDN